MTTELLQQALDALIPLSNAHFHSEREMLTDEDVDAAGLAVVALQAALEAAIAQPASPVQEEPVEYQYQGSDGAWNQFMSDTHRTDTVIDGRSKIRAMYTTPQQAAIAQPEQPAAEPVAWWIPKAEQFCLQDKDGSRPFATAWQPLYASPNIAQPVQPNSNQAAEHWHALYLQQCHKNKDEAARLGGADSRT